MSDSQKPAPTDNIQSTNLMLANSLWFKSIDAVSSTVLKPIIDELKPTMIKRALDVEKKAYCLYSDFQVGACMLVGRTDANTGKTQLTLIDGCNIENQSYGATICAERSAICSMVPRGYTSIFAIAVSTRLGVAPCGICRQVISEFAKFNPPIFIVNSSNDHILDTSFSQLMPNPVTNIFDVEDKKKTLNQSYTANA